VAASEFTEQHRRQRGLIGKWLAVVSHHVGQELQQIGVPDQHMMLDAEVPRRRLGDARFIIFFF
jgi:hypothetical protein